MKVTTILGSPRNKGNTASVLKYFEDTLSRDHVIERINVKEYYIKGCLGCWACQRTLNEHGCVQKDDGTGILDKIYHSDVIVYSTPVYVWSFSAQIKALIDRHCSFVKYHDNTEIHLLKGKKTALLTTCAGDEMTNADLLQQIFLREMEYLECVITGIYVIPHCTQPANLGEKEYAVAEKMAKCINDL